MDKEYLKQRFEDVMYGIPDRIKDVLLRLDSDIKIHTQEIRLRAGKPVALTVKGSQLFVTQNFGTSFGALGNMLVASAQEVNESFIKFCRHSVYSHKSELSNGYLMLRGGYRAGVCGTAVIENGIITSMRDITSLNIRIAKEIKGCADDVIKSWNGGGVLICGAPGSGKTTLIRDMVRQFSIGRAGEPLKVAVVDTRGEIAASVDGLPQADLGSSTDVLIGCPKALGIEMAVRTLYPDIVVFDEIGNMEEVEAVAQGLNAGVKVVTTAHAGSLSDLSRRPQIKKLLETGAIDMLVFCERPAGTNVKIYELKEVACTLFQGG